MGGNAEEAVDENTEKRCGDIWWFRQNVLPLQRKRLIADLLQGGKESQESGAKW